MKSTKNFKNATEFRRIIETAQNCVGIECGECAFNAGAFCGAVYLRGLMALMDGGKAGLYHTAITDEQLHEFIRRNSNEQKELDG